MAIRNPLFFISLWWYFIESTFKILRIFFSILNHYVDVEVRIHFDMAMHNITDWTVEE